MRLFCIVFGEQKKKRIIIIERIAEMAVTKKIGKGKQGARRSCRLAKNKPKMTEKLDWGEAKKLAEKNNFRGEVRSWAERHIRDKDGELRHPDMWLTPPRKIIRRGGQYNRLFLSDKFYLRPSCDGELDCSGGKLTREYVERKWWTARVIEEDHERDMYKVYCEFDNTVWWIDYWKHARVIRFEGEDEEDVEKEEYPYVECEKLSSGEVGVKTVYDW